MKKMLATLISIFILAAIVFLIFNKEETISNPSKLEVASSFYPMYFLTSQIGGDKINVTNITPAGAEPHDYDLTPQDVIKIQNSKLLVLNGVVEPWADKIKQNLKGKDVQILIAGNSLTTGKINENGAMSIDPHVWLSPELAKIESENIASILKNIDPANADYYEANETNLENELNMLDKNYRDALQNCKLRNFITSHAAFGYLAKSYGINQIAIDGLSPDAEPSLKKLADVASFAKENDIKYIFFESLVSPKLSQTIADEIGAKTLVLDPIEGVSSENLSKGVNYLTLMNDNLQNLKIALECK